MLNYRLLLATRRRRVRGRIGAGSVQRGRDPRLLPSVGASSTRTRFISECRAPCPTRLPSQRAASSLRAPWFDVSCCPTNVARTLRP
jgi:hypothetical protein